MRDPPLDPSAADIHQQLRGTGQLALPAGEPERGGRGRGRWEGLGRGRGDVGSLPTQELCDIISKLLVCRSIREKVWAKVGGVVTCTVVPCGAVCHVRLVALTGAD